ncbi:MAG: hypothetical protein N4A50_09535 [Vallitalea sp.]|jgi:competence protein ComGC|nr:hypothetical protein [Vallitalea sp.]
MRKIISNFLKNKSRSTIIEIIVVIVVLLILIVTAVPNQIKKIDNSKKETDVANATLIGNAVAKIINQEDAYNNYSVNKLNISHSIPDKKSLDEELIEELIQEFNKFDMEIPTLKYRKGGFKHFSVTVDKNNIIVYAHNKNVSKSVELFNLKKNKI